MTTFSQICLGVIFVSVIAFCFFVYRAIVYRPVFLCDSYDECSFPYSAVKSFRASCVVPSTLLHVMTIYITALDRWLIRVLKTGEQIRGPGLGRSPSKLNSFAYLITSVVSNFAHIFYFHVFCA